MTDKGMDIVSSPQLQTSAIATLRTCLKEGMVDGKDLK